MQQRHILVSIVLVALALVQSATRADEITPDFSPGLKVPAAAQVGPNFDAERATQSYLALLTPEQRARSDAYFEGKYWLQLWSAVYAVGVLWLMLSTGLAARLRDAARITRFRSVHVLLFGLMFIPVYGLLNVPLDWYTDYFREHQYGASNLTLGTWFGDEIKNLLVLTVLGSIIIVAIYGFIARAAGRWWLWAGGFMAAFFVFLFSIVPLYIFPLFNKYQTLPDGEVRSAILSMAHANGIPGSNVKWYDNSKQTKRISANVSGMLGTAQISLNDNLLNRTSLPEIKAVTAHEMGHYVLGHTWQFIVFYTALFALGFFLLEKFMGRALVRWGPGWRVSERADPATFPLVLIFLTVYFLLATPIVNRFTFVHEVEADIFGLNAAREPYGFATCAMRLGAYRKLEPGPVEKFIFYDHPSGRDRVEMAMRWLQENQALFAPGPKPHEPATQ